MRCRTRDLMRLDFLRHFVRLWLASRASSNQVLGCLVLERFETRLMFRPISDGIDFWGAMLASFTSTLFGSWSRSKLRTLSHLQESIIPYYTIDLKALERSKARVAICFCKSTLQSRSLSIRPDLAWIQFLSTSTAMSQRDLRACTENAYDATYVRRKLPEIAQFPLFAQVVGFTPATPSASTWSV